MRVNVLGPLMITGEGRLTRKLLDDVAAAMSKAAAEREAPRSRSGPSTRSSASPREPGRSGKFSEVKTRFLRPDNKGYRGHQVWPESRSFPRILSVFRVR
jgi:hypothetical protein